MIIMLPPVAEIAAGLLRNAAPIVALLMAVLVVLAVLPAVWSRRPERRCASAQLLDRVLTALSSVATAAVSVTGAVLAVAVGVALPVFTRPAAP